jgi:hypothetical protein
MQRVSCLQPKLHVGGFRRMTSTRRRPNGRFAIRRDLTRPERPFAGVSMITHFNLHQDMPITVLCAEGKPPFLGITALVTVVTSSESSSYGTLIPICCYTSFRNRT